MGDDIIRPRARPGGRAHACGAGRGGLELSQVTLAGTKIAEPWGVLVAPQETMEILL